MDNHVPQDVEALIEELKEDYGVEEPLAPEAERLLKNLRPGTLFIEQLRAAEQLGRLDTSHPRVIKALIELSESDRSHSIKKLAAEALQAPVHQELLRRHPDLEQQVLDTESPSEVAPEEIGPQRKPEPPPGDITKHPGALRQGSLRLTHRDAEAAHEEPTVPSSRIDRTRVTASESDRSRVVRPAAARALRAPGEQQPSQEPLSQTEAADGAIQARHEDAPTKQGQLPPHLHVMTEGDTLRTSWKPPRSEKRKSTLAGAMFLTLSLAALASGAAGAFPRLALPAFGVAAVASAYWLAAVRTSCTSVVAAPDEWVLCRGKWPFPDSRFYLQAVRVDPAACTRVWTHSVETEERISSGSSFDGSADDPVGCLLALGLNALFDTALAERKVIIIHSLFAVTQDGAVKELLPLLSSEEAEALQHMLQRLLDARTASQAQA